MWAPMTRETSSESPGSTRQSGCQRPPYPGVRVAHRVGAAWGGTSVVRCVSAAWGGASAVRYFLGLLKSPHVTDSAQDSAQQWLFVAPPRRRACIVHHEPAKVLALRRGHGGGRACGVWAAGGARRVARCSFARLVARLTFLTRARPPNPTLGVVKCCKRR